MTTTIVATPHWWFAAPVTRSARYCWARLTLAQRDRARDLSYEMFTDRSTSLTVDAAWSAALRAVKS